MFAQDVKSTVKKLVASEMPTMVEEALDEDLCKAVHKAKTGVLSVVYNVFEQEMMKLLRNDVIGEKLDANIAKYFDVGAAAEGWLQRLLTQLSCGPERYVL